MIAWVLLALLVPGASGAAPADRPASAAGEDPLSNDERLRPIVRHPDRARRSHVEAAKGDEGPPAMRLDRERAPSAVNVAAGGLEDLPETDDPRVARLRGRVAADPSDAGNWVDLGNAYAEAGWLDAALRAYTRAVSLDPDLSPAWNDIGAIHLRREEHDEALEAFTRAVHADPGNALAHYNLGVVYDELDRYDDAIASYKQALTLDPNLRLASFNPNIVNNPHLQILNLELYLERGGALVLPLQPGH